MVSGINEHAVKCGYAVQRTVNIYRGGRSDDDQLPQDSQAERPGAQQNGHCKRGTMCPQYGVRNPRAGESLRSGMAFARRDERQETGRETVSQRSG